MIKKILIFLGILVVIGFIIGQASADKPDIYKTICHHNPAQDVTLEFVNQQSYTGHLGTPHNDQVYDTDGACPEPTVVPTEVVTPTIEVTLTPTATPSATPTSTPAGGGDGLSDGRSDGLSSCPSCTQAPQVPAAPPATGRGR